MLDVLREIFPGMQHASFSLVNDIKVHGGAANAGDVVTCSFNNCMVIGELLLGVVDTLRPRLSVGTFGGASSLAKLFSL